MLSLSLPLPIVGEAGPELGWGQGPVSNSLTFGLMTQEATEPHPQLWAAGATVVNCPPKDAFFQVSVIPVKTSRLSFSKFISYIIFLAYGTP